MIWRRITCLQAARTEVQGYVLRYIEDAYSRSLYSSLTKHFNRSTHLIFPQVVTKL